MLMVDYSKVSHLSPSISFFVARLGAFLESSGGHCPQVSAFRLVLTKLYPLLCQSLNLFKCLQEMSVEERVGSKIRSSELEIGLSSSENPIEEDTATSMPSSSKPSSS